MKKKILLIMVMVLILSLSLGFAENKADELNTLQILRGSETGYMLEQRLTRAQALTFVVRLVGGENLVLKRSDIFRNSGFTDVNTDAWYAPYVGYGKGFRLIEGYDDGTFKPESYLSEREFYAMVLNALKIDYTWETVEEVAYENNLITFKNNLNETDYLRASVVDVLYQILDQNKEMIDKLVSSGIVTEDEVRDLKLYKIDELKTEIVKVYSNSKTETILVLNENISEIDLLIEEIAIEDYSIDGNMVTIDHESTNSNESYELRVKSVIDNEGFVVTDLMKEFIAFKDEPIESNYFMVSDIEVISKNQLNVYFTQDITLNAALPLYYDIYQNGEILVEGDFNTIKAKKMSSVDNGISLWLRDEFLKENTEYSIVIDEDVTSIYSIKLDDVVERKFIGNGKENESLEIDSFEVLNEDYIRIVFSEDISDGSLDLSNFSLYEEDNEIDFGSPVQVRFTGARDKKYRQIDIKYLNLDKDKEYKLIIEDIEDRFEAKSLDEVIPFSGISETKELELEAVIAQNQGTILLYFNEPISKDSTLSNILVQNPSRSINTRLFTKENPYQVVLLLDSTDRLSDNIEYEINILPGSIKDLNGESNDSIVRAFDGTDNPYPDTKFTDAYFVSDDFVYVEFNKPIDTSTLKSNFKLKYKDNDGDDQSENASGISFLNPYEAVIKFKDLDTSENYKIYGDNVDDYTNQFQSDEFYKSVDRE